MTSHLVLRFCVEDVEARVQLLPDVAPRTVEALVAHLPLAGATHHATYSGSECVLILDPWLDLGPENATADMEVGDVAFTRFDVGDAHGVEKRFSEIAWFYDVDGQPQMPEGPAPMNRFGRIVDGQRDFYALCRRMRRTGVRPFVIEDADWSLPSRRLPVDEHALDPHPGLLDDGSSILGWTQSPTPDGQDPRRRPTVSVLTSSGWQHRRLDDHIGWSLEQLQVVEDRIAVCLSRGEDRRWLEGPAQHGGFERSRPPAGRVATALELRDGALELRLPNLRGTHDWPGMPVLVARIAANGGEQLVAWEAWHGRPQDPDSRPHRGVRLIRLGPDGPIPPSTTSERDR